MSKAFTRESDDLPEQRPAAKPITPAGRITASGAQTLRAELNALAQDSHAESRCQDIERILATAEIVPPPAQPWEQAMFGATIVVRDSTGQESQYRIVGAEEIDLDKNWVGVTSPVARALLKARLGQRVSLRLPTGEQHLTIIDIRYE